MISSSGGFRIVFCLSRTKNYTFHLTNGQTKPIFFRFETYLIGKLTNFIWGEDWDVRCCVNNSTKMSFGKAIHDMYEPNLEAQIKNYLTCNVHINVASI
jgi:hypothetical protein